VRRSGRGLRKLTGRRIKDQLAIGNGHPPCTSSLHSCIHQIPKTHHRNSQGYVHHDAWGLFPFTYDRHSSPPRTTSLLPLACLPYSGRTTNGARRMTSQHRVKNSSGWPARTPYSG
jgi:hypothetical protein